MSSTSRLNSNDQNKNVSVSSVLSKDQSSTLPKSVSSTSKTGLSYAAKSEAVSKSGFVYTSKNAGAKDHISKSGLGKTTPMSKNQTIKSNDFLALAEKARQDYLLKMSSTSSLKTAGDNKKSTSVMDQTKTTNATTQGVSQSKSNINTTNTNSTSMNAKSKPNLIEVKPAPVNGNPVKFSIRDRISNFESTKTPNQNGKNSQVEVGGVTEDHSHTEASLSNGTIKKPNKSNGVGESGVVAPPKSFTDLGETQIDIIPPPPSFSEEIDVQGVPAFSAGTDDAASFVSSVSSLSTLSSEHGEGGLVTRPHSHHHPSTTTPAHHYDDIIVPPPPPPEFDDGSGGAK